MLPPTFALQMLIMIAGLLGFGMCFGWAWGCAAMAAANQARSQALLQSQQQAVQARCVPLVDASRSLTSGAAWPARRTLRRTIRTRSFMASFSTGARPSSLASSWPLLCFGSRLPARKSPSSSSPPCVCHKRAHTRHTEPVSQIFASIVIDVMCSYGPLFPTPNYTLAKLFLCAPVTSSRVRHH